MLSMQSLINLLHNICDQKDVDDYSEKNFKSIANKYLENPSKHLYRTKFKVGSSQYLNLFDFIYTLSNDALVKFYFYDVPKGMKWFYSVPVVLIEYSKEHSYIYTLPVSSGGDIANNNINKEEILLKFYIRRYFYPESRKDSAVRGFAERVLNINFSVYDLPGLVTFLNKTKLFPLEIGIIAYTKSRRIHLILETITGIIKYDERNDKLSKNMQSSFGIKEYYVIDQLIANADLSEDTKYLIESIFEVKELSYMEILDIVKLPQDKVDLILNNLESKKWIEREGSFPNVRYHINEEFLKNALK